jgi:hypothetical protein
MILSYTVGVCPAGLRSFAGGAYGGELSADFPVGMSQVLIAARRRRDVMADPSTHIRPLVGGD